MDLYLAPLACSMASRIALYAAGGRARFVQVDTRAKRVLEDGSDFLALNPLGQVPVLRTDEGLLLTENSAILQHIAGRHPAAALMPPEGFARDEMRQWLSFVGTELHKAVFTPLLDPAAPEAARAYAREKAGPRLDLLEAHLEGRDWLLQGFGIADAFSVDTPDGYREVARRVNARRGVAYARVLIDPTEPPRTMPSRDGANTKNVFRASLGLTGF